MSPAAFGATMRLFRRTTPYAVLACSLLLSAAGCGTKESSQSASNAPPTEATTTAPALSDGAIAAIVIAANDADIDNGRQAESRSKDADVQQFAKLMITDHSAVNDKAKALAAQIQLTPEPGDSSRQLTAEQDSIRQQLGARSGASFDKAYVDNEVAYHQHVLDAIDHTLIPDAKNAQLKQLLTDTRPAVAQHLDHALQLQAKLNRSATNNPSNK
jgi:putative membrane protein